MVSLMFMVVVVVVPVAGVVVGTSIVDDVEGTLTDASSVCIMATAISFAMGPTGDPNCCNDRNEYERDGHGSVLGGTDYSCCESPNKKGLKPCLKNETIVAVVAQSWTPCES